MLVLGIQVLAFVAGLRSLRVFVRVECGRFGRYIGRGKRGQIGRIGCGGHDLEWVLALIALIANSWRYVVHIDFAELTEAVELEALRP